MRMIEHQPGPVPPLPPDAHGAVCHAGVAGHPVGGRRLRAPIVPPCAFWSARWLAKPQGVMGERNRFADGDSRTRCCDASTNEPMKRGKERYLAHSNPKMAR